MSLLVGGKVSEIAREFEDGISDIKWADVGRGTSLRNTFWTGLVSLYCCGAAQFHFRIVELLSD